MTQDDKKTAGKTLLAAAEGIHLIAIYPEDLADLDVTLGALLT